MSIAGLPVSTVDEAGEDYFKVLIHGPQGSGKTTLASTIAEVGKTLFVDMKGERGTRSFKGASYAKNVDVVRPESVTALDDIFWYLNAGDHPYKAVVVDSLTSLQKTAMRFMMGHDETAVKEISQGVAPADQRTWGQTLDIMTDHVLFWYSLAESHRQNPIHVIMTAQTKTIGEREDSPEDFARIPDVQRGAVSITLSTPDYVLYTDKEEDIDAEVSDDGPVMRHIVRFGSDPEYRTKGRVPRSLWGKFPKILGRKSQLTLGTLGSLLEVGGVPKRQAKKKPAEKPAKQQSK